jgi:hypothetical protein
MLCVIHGEGHNYNHYAECHHAECRYTEGRDTPFEMTLKNWPEANTFSVTDSKVKQAHTLKDA